MAAVLSSDIIASLVASSPAVSFPRSPLACSRSRKRRRPRSRPVARRAPTSRYANKTSLLAAATATAITVLLQSSPAAAIHNECADNLAYLTKHNLKCHQHTLCGEGIKRAYGYDDSDILMLKYNCPQTCGLCGSRSSGGGAAAAGSIGDRPKAQGIQTNDNINGGIDYNNYGDGDAFNVLKNPNNDNGGGGAFADLKKPKRKPQMRPPPSSESTYNRYANGVLTEACHEGWHPYCQDDNFYYSKVSLPCWFHTKLYSDCTVWLEAGYSRDDVWELINYCPCTCGIECGKSTHFPTDAPTYSPSSKPSAGPTISFEPTVYPSAQPSSAPISSPSAWPSSTPTVSPTAPPSASPSSTPTSSPSGTPSITPTASPSILPSVQPTTSPSGSPSATASALPSANPTASASYSPSNLSSASPSAQPTTLPSSSPSAIPTRPPSNTHSQLPSFLPSSSPTVHASNMPSISHSDSPSVLPTNQPSRRPTLAPVMSFPPTEAPATAVPTPIPSKAPATVLPTPIPSRAPTDRPREFNFDAIVKIESALAEEDGTYKQPIICPYGFTGLIPTSDCKAAYHCANGMHTFGPMPCPRGPSGYVMVFDIIKQTCAMPSRSFVCQSIGIFPSGSTHLPVPSAQAVATPLPTLLPSSKPTLLLSDSPTKGPTHELSFTPTIRHTPSSRPVKTAFPTPSPTYQSFNNDLVGLVQTPQESRDANDAITVSPSSRPTRRHTKSDKVDPSNDLGEYDINDMFASGQGEVAMQDSQNQEEQGRKDNIPNSLQLIFQGKASDGSSFSPHNIAIVVTVGVILLVLIISTASLIFFHYRKKRRQRQKKQKHPPPVSIKPGDKVEIEGMDGVEKNDTIGDDEEEIGANPFISTFFGFHGQFQSKDDNSTIQTTSIKSTPSKAKSLALSLSKSLTFNSTAATEETLKTIESARQRSIEATRKPLTPVLKSASKAAQPVVDSASKAAEEAKRVAKDPVTKVAEQTVHDFSQIGDRAFKCASALLCLPNEVEIKSAQSRSSSSRQSRSRKRRSSRYRRREKSDYFDDGSVYEDC